ncbi:MAG: hypothetical protein ACYC1D_19785 [Acidimicrobiales bacterium]
MISGVAPAPRRPISRIVARRLGAGTAMARPPSGISPAGGLIGLSGVGVEATARAWGDTADAADSYDAAVIRRLSPLGARFGVARDA